MIGSVKSSCCSPGSSGRPVSERVPCSRLHASQCLEPSPAPPKNRLPVSLSRFEASSSGGWVAITSQIRTISDWGCSSLPEAHSQCHWLCFHLNCLAVVDKVCREWIINKKKHLQIALAQGNNRQPTYNEKQMHLKLSDRIEEVFLDNQLSLTVLRWALVGMMERWNGCQEETCWFKRVSCLSKET